MLGTHDELIRDPNGAYSQLVQMQQGSKQDEKVKKEDADVVEITTDSDDLIRSSSRRSSAVRRSLSHGSSRHSFSLNYPIPGLINIHEYETGNDQADEEPDKRTLEKRKRVSIRRLASLNKPEWPYLLVGAIAAGIHGLIFPVFGLLLSTAIKIFFEPRPELQKDSRFWATMYVCLGLVSLIVAPIQNFFFGVAGGKLIQRIRSLTFKKVVYHEISWFDEPANSRYPTNTECNQL